MRTTTLHHLGTVAHGSLIIAIIKTIRAVIAYIQRKAKKMHNKVVEYVMMCLQCFMWCLEKIMKFINKHAYIITAIYGHSFCKSARKAFWLLLRNILRVAAVNMLSTFLLMMGRILIPVATTFVCYLAIAYGTNNAQVSGIVAPLVLCFLLSYWIACMFLEIFGMGIETILFCFIADEEMFKLEERFASGELMTTIQQTAQQAASLKIAPDIAEAKDAKVVHVRALVALLVFVYAFVVYLTLSSLWLCVCAGGGGGRQGAARRGEGSARRRSADVAQRSGRVTGCSHC